MSRIEWSKVPPVRRFTSISQLVPSGLHGSSLGMMLTKIARSEVRTAVDVTRSPIFAGDVVGGIPVGFGGSIRSRYQPFFEDQSTVFAVIVRTTGCFSV